MGAFLISLPIFSGYNCPAREAKGKKRKVNKDKTQMLRIGKKATLDPVLCSDLGLKWVERLKVLGITLSATPSEIMENFDAKILEIEALLNRWTFRNMTVYGRIRVVKSLVLSKITHLVQIIPNPPAPLVLKMQRFEGVRHPKLRP